MGLSCFTYPYGDGLSCSGPDEDATEQHFTGKQYDPESGNYYFGARYDADNYGRFLTPDWSAKVEPVPYAKLDDPQSLNLYAFVLDNPVSAVDADGHDSIAAAERMVDENIQSMDADYASYLAGVASHSYKQKGIAATPTYGSQTAAAEAAEKAALAATNKSGRKYEYGGWGLRDRSGRYTFTIPVATATRPGMGLFSPFDVSVPKGFTAVFTYHTHPHSFEAEGQGLSIMDEQWAYNFHMTLYEADTYSRNMYRFTPGKSKFVPNAWCCGVIGDLVTHIP